jgi:class 3 adenylate cyclase/pimeloyl-ACP methyl ester carboxylesterase
MMSAPQTHYARSGTSSVAFQIVGEGPIDLVLAPGFVSHLDLQWTIPTFAEFIERLTSFARVIIFDKRGTGLSDPTPGAERFDSRMEDIRVVMDAADSRTASLVGMSEGGPLAMLFAASSPERVDNLILYGTFPGGWALGDETLAQFEAAVARWGEGHTADIFSKSSDSVRRRLAGLFERASASPSMANALIQSVKDVDVTPVLSLIDTPTLVMHRRDDPFAASEWSEYLALRIEGSQKLLLEGGEHIPWFGEVASIASGIERFITGRQSQPMSHRALHTVLFTDIVASTATLSKIGDASWRQTIDRHNLVMRAELARSGGRLIKTTGDGILAVFPGPTRAIECAFAAIDKLGELGIEIRSGIHTGEVEEMSDGDIGGLAVNIAARIMALAPAGGVLVSSTVRDLVMGSDYDFVSRGWSALKGVPGQWELHEAIERPVSIAPDHPSLRATDRLSLLLARRAPRAVRTVAALAGAARGHAQADAPE